MNKFAIVADSSCDINSELKQKYDIVTVNGHVVYPDKTEINEYPDWSNEKREKFYKELGKDPDSYATAPPNVEEFAAAFEKCVENGQDVLAITISGGISGAVGFAQQAKKQVLEKHPDAKIEVVDSLRFSAGHGLIVILAALYRAEGHSIGETAAYIEANKNRVHQCGWLDDLSFVAKKGRLTQSKAFFGKLAGIKPIGEFDYNGLTTVIGKVKGAKKAYAVLLDYLENTVENPSDQIIFIAQTNRLAQAEQYKQMILERFKPKDVIIIDVLPFCGVNIGPGLMAAYYVGKPISKGLETEKALIQKLIDAQG